jgi:hypothetical protein
VVELDAILIYAAWDKGNISIIIPAMPFCNYYAKTGHLVRLRLL